MAKFLLRKLFFVLAVSPLFGFSQLFQEDFGTFFTTLNTTNWPTTCASGASTYNTSIGSCAGAGDYAYYMSGFTTYRSTSGIAIPSTGYDLTFDYSFDYFLSFPEIEIRTGGTCGTTLQSTITLTNTSGVCTAQTINLDAYAGQTIFIRFCSRTSSATFYIDNVLVDGSGGGSGSGDYKWADNFNDNDLNLDYTGTDGDETCTGCGTWSLGSGATLELVPAAGWNGNTNETEAFVANMSNVYYVKLDRNEYIESPVIDMSSMESLKISFYAKSSSSGTGGGDNWNFSDRLKLQIWDGASWITVQSIRDDFVNGWSGPDDFVSSGLPFNYFCFTAYKSSTSPGNYYYNSTPNVNSAYFHSGFKFRVIFEDGFFDAPFAWVDDFTFRADADGYSTMIPCGLSFWNEPTATSYGQDVGTSGNNNAEKGVELELDNSINIPPNWTTEADDGDVHDQVFGGGEAERIVFCVISEQEINFAFPKVHFYAPSMGWQSSTMSIDNNYTGPGWKYYAVEYISCDLAGGSIAEPTDDFRYYFSFEYGNEFMPVYYQLNTSGIEYGGGVTSISEVFNAPDLTSTDNCGAVLPINLLSFDARKDAENVLLNWKTESELNNSHFELEKSANGIDFEHFATVSAIQNSSKAGDYTFLDESPFSGISYYRLKQVDLDGKFAYSELVSVNFSEENAILVYPNPAKTQIQVVFGEKTNKKWQIFNVLGQNVSQKVKIAKQTENALELNLEQLSKGIYHFVFESGETVKFVKE